MGFTNDMIINLRIQNLYQQPTSPRSSSEISISRHVISSSTCLLSIILEPIIVSHCMANVKRVDDNFPCHHHHGFLVYYLRKINYNLCVLPQNLGNHHDQLFYVISLDDALCLYIAAMERNPSKGFPRSK